MVAILIAIVVIMIIESCGGGITVAPVVSGLILATSELSS